MTMKKTILSMLALCAGILQGAAAVPVERIYVSTDREVYVAGDAVWCSLTCLDGNGRFSNESAVSYLELVSEAGTACTAKIGLLEGRGAGSFRIPVTAPTGTYRLVAYTAVNAGEEGTPWMAGSRLLTVFNTTSAARVPDGVEILDEPAYESLPQPEAAPQGALQLSARTRLPKGAPAALVLSNGGSRASVSLSVRHEDDLRPAAQENSPESFRILSENSLASRAIFPCSRISPSAFVSMPSSVSLPVRRMVSDSASMRMHWRMVMVVLEGTAFRTIFTAFSKFSFRNVSFMDVDNSFRKICAGGERKNRINSAVIVLGIVDMWKRAGKPVSFRDSPCVNPC